MNDSPGFTFAPGPEKPGMYAPSEPNRYRTPWKCIECGWFVTVSRFRKWTTSLSPTRAWRSGPCSPGLPGPFGICFAKSFVYWR